MSYSELELDFNFAINSESESESESSSEFRNLDICTFLLCICTLLNKHVDNFFYPSHNRINSYTDNAGIMHIFFWYFIT